MITFLSTSEQQTRGFGRRLAAKLKKGDILCLFGDLGAGKTTFVKGLAQGLRIDPTQVHSPTFMIMALHEGRLPLYHFDLYRLEETAQIAAIGYEEFLYGTGVSVVEWAERFGPLMPEQYLEVRILNKTETQRGFRVKAHGPRYKDLLAKIEDLT